PAPRAGAARGRALLLRAPHTQGDRPHARDLGIARLAGAHARHVAHEAAHAEGCDPARRGGVRTPVGTGGERLDPPPFLHLRARLVEQADAIERTGDGRSAASLRAVVDAWWF